MTYTVTVTSQGQITLPKAIRSQFKDRKLLIEGLPDGRFILGSFSDIKSFKNTLRLKKNSEFKSMDELVKFHEGVGDEVFS